MKVHWGTLIAGLILGYLILPQLVGAVRKTNA